MNFHDTRCCAVQEILQLSSHTNAKEAMTAFYTQTIKKGYVKFVTRKEEGVLYSFYLFTAAVEKDGSGGYNGNYGVNFYNYIKEHNLGECWQSPVVINTAFHKDHANQIYIWMPNYQALQEWWERLYPETPHAE